MCYSALDRDCISRSPGFEAPLRFELNLAEAKIRAEFQNIYQAETSYRIIPTVVEFRRFPSVLKGKQFLFSFLWFQSAYSSKAPIPAARNPGTKNATSGYADPAPQNVE